MKSFREYLSEEIGRTHIDLYTRGDQEKIDSILNFSYENREHIHFHYYNKGIYSFTDLKSALDNSHYGKYILKFRIAGGVKNFFYTSYEAYKQAVNPNAKDGIYVDDVPFIYEQLKKFGLSKQYLLKNDIYPASSYKYKQNPNNEFKGVGDFQRFCLFLERKNLIPNSIKGIEYLSNADDNCFLVFDNKTIIPLKI